MNKILIKQYYKIVDFLLLRRNRLSYCFGLGVFSKKNLRGSGIVGSVIISRGADLKIMSMQNWCRQSGLEILGPSDPYLPENGNNAFCC